MTQWVGEGSGEDAIGRNLVECGMRGVRAGLPCVFYMTNNIWHDMSNFYFQLIISG